MKSAPSDIPVSATGLPELKGLNARDLLIDGLQSDPTLGKWEPPTPAHLARLLPQYQIVELIGHGGMGAVYKGMQAQLGRAVAIKILPAEMTADEQFAARFQRESRTLAQLQHPGIVSVYDSGRTKEGHLYFIMEFVDGTDLAQVIRGKNLNADQALELTLQICAALHYAHQQGVVHRDIKPANVLISTNGRVKLADFGLARPVSEEAGALTGSQMVMGTPDYMAPEQRAGLGDHRADIYALGVMLYEMLTGKRPQGVFDPPSQKVQVDVRLDEVVVKAMRQEPERRYQQVSEMRSDVESIRDTPPPAREPVGEAMAKPMAMPEPTRRGKKGASFWIISGALALVMVLAVSIAVVKSRVKPPAEKSDSARVNDLQTIPAPVEKTSASPENGSTASATNHPIANTPGVKMEPTSMTPPVAKNPSSPAVPSPGSASQPETRPPAAPAATPPPVAAATTHASGSASPQEALLNHVWEWAHPPNPPDQLTFHADGTATSPRFSWHWKMTGPHTAVAYDAIEGGYAMPNFKATLTFDEKFTSLTGVTDDGRFHYTGRRTEIAPAVAGATIQPSPLADLSSTFTVTNMSPGPSLEATDRTPAPTPAIPDNVPVGVLSIPRLTPPSLGATEGRPSLPLGATEGMPGALSMPRLGPPSPGVTEDRSSSVLGVAGNIAGVPSVPQNMAAEGADLERALSSYKWQWNDGAKALEAVFKPDGTMKNPEGHTTLHWRVMGRRTFAVTTKRGDSIFTVDETLTRFEGKLNNEKNIVGIRLDAPSAGTSTFR